jgi:hypothetical protein
MSRIHPAQACTETLHHEAIQFPPAMARPPGRDEGVPLLVVPLRCTVSVADLLPIL